MTRIITKKQAYQGRTIGVDEVELDFENGKRATYELATFKVVTGVTALPVVVDEVILIKHYQAGIDREAYALPTGGLNPGEDPFERMNEELMEEIGMRARDLTLMIRSDILPGYIGSEAGYLFLARDLVEERKAGDEEYPIKIEKIPLKTALEMVKNQAITDLRTVSALLWYARFIKVG